MQSFEHLDISWWCENKKLAYTLVPFSNSLLTSLSCLTGHQILVLIFHMWIFMCLLHDITTTCDLKLFPKIYHVRENFYFDWKTEHCSIKLISVYVNNLFIVLFRSEADNWHVHVIFVSSWNSINEYPPDLKNFFQVKTARSYCTCITISILAYPSKNCQNHKSC